MNFWYNISEAPKRRSAEAPKRRSAEAPKRRSAEAPKRRSAEAPKRRSAEAPKRRKAMITSGVWRRGISWRVLFSASLAGFCGYWRCLLWRYSDSRRATARRPSRAVRSLLLPQTPVIPAQAGIHLSTFLSFPLARECSPHRHRRGGSCTLPQPPERASTIAGGHSDPPLRIGNYRFHICCGFPLARECSLHPIRETDWTPRSAGGVSMFQVYFFTVFLPTWRQGLHPRRTSPDNLCVGNFLLTGCTWIIV